MKCQQQVPRALRQGQSGVSLIFALIALVAMTLGAVALIRSVDTGILALGNLSFNQSGLGSSARAADAAITFLEANILAGATLDGDIPAKGYYASSLDTLDPTGRTAETADVQALVDWERNGCKVNGQASGAPSCQTAVDTFDVGGDQVSYIITRLCELAGPFEDANCSSPMVSGTAEGTAHGAGSYSVPTNFGAPRISPYFRIITRSVGPKGTVSYTETLVHF
jgi:Tfp pilus assembly protein PilX